MQINDRVTVITGASAGIGLATARRFAAAGAKVVLAARSAGVLEKVAAELRGRDQAAFAVPTDMRDRADVERMVEAAWQHFGRIDVLINNAGQSAAGTVAEASVDDYRQIIELNLFGPIYAMQAAIPKMRQAGGGIIINVSSMVSKMHIPGLGTYASTKAALNVLSETARAELEGDNIRVITVYPRLTATDFGKNALGSRERRQQQRSAGHITPDTAEHVAERILQAVLDEPAEQYME